MISNLWPTSRKSFRKYCDTPSPARNHLKPRARAFHHICVPLPRGWARLRISGLESRASFRGCVMSCAAFAAACATRTTHVTSSTLDFVAVRTSGHKTENGAQPRTVDVYPIYRDTRRSIDARESIAWTYTWAITIRTHTIYTLGPSPSQYYSYTKARISQIATRDITCRAYRNDNGSKSAVSAALASCVGCDWMTPNGARPCRIVPGMWCGVCVCKASPLRGGPHGCPRVNPSIILCIHLPEMCVRGQLNSKPFLSMAIKYIYDIHGIASQWVEKGWLCVVHSWRLVPLTGCIHSMRKGSMFVGLCVGLEYIRSSSASAHCVSLHCGLVGSDIGKCGTCSVRLNCGFSVDSI